MKFNEFTELLHLDSKYYLDGYLRSDKKGKGYICPECGNGDGEDGDGIREDPKKPGHYKCFRCGFYGDALDIVGIKEGLKESKDKFKKAAELFGIKIDSDNNRIWQGNLNPETKAGFSLQEKRKKALNSLDTSSKKVIKQAQKNFLNDKESIQYLLDRKISYKTAVSAGVGSIFSFKGIKKGLVFPSSLAGFNVRNLDQKCLKKDRFRKNNGVDLPYNIMNVKRESDYPLFITEGEIDALSFLEIGWEAISVNGQGREALLFSLQEYSIKRPLVLVFDNDEAGRKGQKKVLNLLLENSFKVSESQILKGQFKDPNECLCLNEEYFRSAVQKEAEKFKEKSGIDTIERSNVTSVLEKLRSQIISKSAPVAVNTGFPTLDSPLFLDGGIHNELYIVGGISSIGKSTFVLQIADQIASHGRDVFIVSLEMSALNLTSKSLSRLSFLTGSKIPFSARDIMNAGSQVSNVSLEAFNHLAKIYQKQIGDRITIIEDEQDMNLNKIEKLIKSYYENRGIYPVLIIDYLQVLKPYKTCTSYKQAIDDNISKLKSISKQYDIPVIGISSLNRESYRNDTEVNYSSYNGSSSIEYTTDVLISLEESKNQETIQHDKNEKLITLKILKNRNGCPGNEITFRFYQKYNYFEDIGTKEVDEIGKINETEKRYKEIMSLINS